MQEVLKSELAPLRKEMDSREFVAWAYRTTLRRECGVGDLDNFVTLLDSNHIDRLSVLERLLTSAEYEKRASASRSLFPDGHFYSPVPSASDIEHYAKARRTPSALPGVDLGLKEQITLLQSLEGFYSTIPFTDEPKPGFRYHYNNGTYSYGDAIFLHSMIRWLQPERIVEIGSGNSSCVTLDTNEYFFQNRIKCTFIVPYPQLLQSLMKSDDRLDLLPDFLQNIDPALFATLDARDILFVDSTHVSKLNSDVNRLFFEILPSLKKGVFIHFHDVFYPFEYPLKWLEEGRAWNEQYLLRAFLQYNTSFRIRLFPGYLLTTCRTVLSDHFPLVLRNPGGSIWIEKVH